MYETIANLLKESKKTIIITGNDINIDLKNIESKSLKKYDNKFINYYRDVCKQILVNQSNKAYNIIEQWKIKI